MFMERQKCSLLIFHTVNLLYSYSCIQTYLPWLFSWSKYVSVIQFLPLFFILYAIFSHLISFVSPSCLLRVLLYKNCWVKCIQILFFSPILLYLMKKSCHIIFLYVFSLDSDTPAFLVAIKFQGFAAKRFNFNDFYKFKFY